MSIDSSSIVSSSSKIHSSVDIGPFCIIGDDVELGRHFCIESCNHQRAN